MNYKALWLVPRVSAAPLGGVTEEMVTLTFTELAYAQFILRSRADIFVTHCSGNEEGSIVQCTCSPSHPLVPQSRSLRLAPPRPASPPGPAERSCSDPRFFSPNRSPKCIHGPPCVAQPTSCSTPCVERDPVPHESSPWRDPGAAGQRPRPRDFGRDFTRCFSRTNRHTVPSLSRFRASNRARITVCPRILMLKKFSPKRRFIYAKMCSKFF